VTGTGSADLSGLRIDREKPRTDTSPTRRRWALAATAGVILLAVGIVAAGALNPKRTEVTVVRVEALGGGPGPSGSGVSSEVLTANGYVVARQRASVSTEVAGRLAALYVEEGSRVRKGQVMGVLRNEDLKASLQSASTNCWSRNA